MSETTKPEPFAASRQRIKDRTEALQKAAGFLEKTLLECKTPQEAFEFLLALDEVGQTYKADLQEQMAAVLDPAFDGGHVHRVPRLPRFGGKLY